MIVIILKIIRNKNWQLCKGFLPSRASGIIPEPLITSLSEDYNLGFNNSI